MWGTVSPNYKSSVLRAQYLVPTNQSSFCWAKPGAISHDHEKPIHGGRRAEAEADYGAISIWYGRIHSSRLLDSHSFGGNESRWRLKKLKNPCGLMATLEIHRPLSRPRGAQRGRLIVLNYPLCDWDLEVTYCAYRKFVPAGASRCSIPRPEGVHFWIALAPIPAPI